MNSSTYLHQPFVIEGDAYREDVVKQNQSDSANPPTEELDRARHAGLPGSAVPEETATVGRSCPN